eukprot:TRINITY_DN19047_c0_g2_i1.p1 TRINITY_DN19047_c0_g2~~TRINITY_DN19047_c0_g2_i1.p1  ORF type:complete len:340 (-),score=34.25 TRINITY_DN19047_c0_g2_i1:51-1043(-)
MMPSWAALLVALYGVGGAPSALPFSDSLYHRRTDPEEWLAGKRRYAMVHKNQSTFQLVRVVEDKAMFNRQLYHGASLQLTFKGEHMYHEMMAHVPLTTAKVPPRDVLILGAGDGGIALRVLKHPGVRKVVQVEIDEAVVFASRKFFPHLASAYDDSRVDLKYQDAISWVVDRASAGQRDEFDICIIDIFDDPLNSSWSAPFYVALRQLLRPDALLMQNMKPMDQNTHFASMLQMHKDGGFRIVRPVFISTIDYGSPYVSLLSSGTMYNCPGPARTDDALLEKLKVSWYSPEIHRSSLAIPAGMQRRWADFVPDKHGCLLVASAEQGKDEL